MVWEVTAVKSLCLRMHSQREGIRFKPIALGGGEEQKSRDINRIQIVSSVRQAITSKADYERITLAHKSFLDTGSRGDSLRGI